VRWRRGFFRAWVASSALWVIIAGGFVFARWYNDPGRVISVRSTPHAAPTPNEPDDWMLAIPDARDPSKTIGIPCASLPNGCLVGQPKEGLDYSLWWASLIRSALWTLGPPIIVLTIGWLAFWVVAGFRS
jgi:hypothetical protein